MRAAGIGLAGWLSLASPAAAQDLDVDAVLEAHRDKTIQAYRTTEEIAVDGVMDEEAWREAVPASDFLQSEPEFGRPASERTEVRLLYDDDYLYVGAYCFDSEGPAGVLVNDIRRDFSTRDNDVFEIVLDTFDDDRNGFLFGTNPEGARFDGQFGSEGGNFNRDWDAIWYTRARTTEQGWQLEMAIPFKTLRFQGAETQVWGVNFLRRIRRKNEDSFWSPIPRAFRITRVSLAGTLTGIQGVRQGRNLYVKPYLVAPLTRFEGDDVDFRPEAGLDVKYGLNSQLTLDLTLNTDFSQVEADEERINLTRFSLFFPEKREFFLENSSIFQFGPGRGGGGGGGGGRAPDLVPFFSRRIGISDGELVPILGGARLSGRMGHYTLGLLTMRADEAGEIPSTHFSVVRVKRDLLRRSDVGALFVDKRDSTGLTNRTFGVDTNFRFFEYLDVSGSVLRTDTPGAEGGESAAQAQLEWDDDLYSLRIGYLTIGDDFNPEVGFVRRVGIRQTSGRFEWNPRPGERIPSIRKLGPSIRADYITDQEGQLETRQLDGGFEVQFQDGGFLRFSQEFTFERLDEPFEVRDGQFIGEGDYGFNEFSASYSSDRSKMLSGNLRYATGGFFDGERDSYRVGLQLQPGYRFSAGMTWSHNQLDLPSGGFSTDLVSSRFAYSFNTRMFLNALVQYNSASGEISSNIRFNFNYKPLNDFFLVYNERRSSSGEVLDRALIAKLTYVFSF